MEFGEFYIPRVLTWHLQLAGSDKLPFIYPPLNGYIQRLYYLVLTINAYKTYKWLQKFLPKKHQLKIMPMTQMRGRNRTIFAHLPLVEHENRKLGNSREEHLPPTRCFPVNSQFTYLITPTPGLSIPFSELNSGPLKRYVHLGPINTTLGKEALIHN